MSSSFPATISENSNSSASSSDGQQQQHGQLVRMDSDTSQGGSTIGPLPPKGSMDKRRTFRRTRSLNAPSPIQQFGPCGRIMKNSAMVMQVTDPAFQRLTWYKNPLTVLVIKKTRDISVLSPLVQLTRWLIEDRRLVVHVEEAVMNDSALNSNPQFLRVRDKLQVFQEGRDDLTDKIDFIICLGGDGTLLYASSLFQQSVPPVMAFHLGSLGFLTPFRFDNFQEQVTNVLEGNAALTLRSRLKCVLKRRQSVETSSDHHSSRNGSSTLTHNNTTNSNSNCSSPNSNSTSTNNGTTAAHAPGNSAGRSIMNFLVLNEVVVDRGPSPYLSNVDLFVDGKHVTVVQGDGLILSTPTGSTAYAVAAGASMIHPSVPAIMITPICPHSLSFRPIVVPAGVELKIKISPESRNTAWVSFDGRSRQELKHGDALSVTTSVYPVPSICAQDQIQDWFDSLADCLQWNVRKRQKQMEEVEDSIQDTPDNSEYYDIMDT